MPCHRSIEAVWQNLKILVDRIVFPTTRRTVFPTDDAYPERVSIVRVRSPSPKRMDPDPIDVVNRAPKIRCQRCSKPEYPLVRQQISAGSATLMARPIRSPR